jgi:low affinity Fe/Cu permease
VRKARALGTITTLDISMHMSATIIIAVQGSLAKRTRVCVMVVGISYTASQMRTVAYIQAVSIARDTAMMRYRVGGMNHAQKDNLVRCSNSACWFSVI